ncbi:hypothetical protein HHX47_DHR5000137 [Lentinula edodes]|nr:hypothetical protein HHX47_DHR5000137 [Lentinula edodes]
MSTPPTFDPKNMPFRRLGPSGLRVPVFSLGGWLTFGKSVVGDPCKVYSQGKSEEEMGRVIKELGWRRSDIVVTTKLYWGTRPGPNNGGLSRKHIIEGTQESLARLQLDYVDVIFAHRADTNVPMEEVVRAFNYVIEKGWCVDTCLIDIADKLHLIPPIAEQCQHNMFHRERPEKEYAKIYSSYNIGTTVWSALASGLLTGKYNDGIPEGSRFDVEKSFFSGTLKELQSPEGQEKIRKVKELTKLAQEELQTTPSALALAWVARNPNTSTVILGATKPEQLLENLKAIEVIPKLTPEILEKIEAILGNKPGGVNQYGRPSLDPFGKLSHL